MKSISVAELADLLNGTVVGDSNKTISGVSKIDQSFPGTLSFIANPKYEGFLSDTQASVVLVNRDSTLVSERITLIKVDDAYTAFCHVLNVYFNTYSHKSGIESGAFIHPEAHLEEGVYVGSGSYISQGAHVGKNTKIYPGCYIGEQVKIGQNSVFYAGVKVYHDCKIGSQCLLHAGVVVGSDGFGHAPQKDGTYMKIPQIGNVIIEDDVEIGANTTVDRATLGSTIIRKGVKLDNLIQVAHNVEIGENTVIAAHTGISGSVRIGKNCIIGGQVGFVGHIQIADGTQIGAQSGISKNVTEKNQQWIGSPIMPLREAFKTQVVYRNLPALKQRIEQLETELKALKSGNHG